MNLNVVFLVNEFEFSFFKVNEFKFSFSQWIQI